MTKVRETHTRKVLEMGKERVQCVGSRFTGVIYVYVVTAVVAEYDRVQVKGETGQSTTAGPQIHTR